MEELIDDRYLAPAFKMLDKLEVGQTIIIADVAPNKPDLFIDCAKQYCDCFGTILFNNSMTEIRKVKSRDEEHEGFSNRGTKAQPESIIITQLDNVSTLIK